jgi:hypothetical protein
VKISAPRIVVSVFLISLNRLSNSAIDNLKR